jgi:hypothetical protein
VAGTKGRGGGKRPGAGRPRTKAPAPPKRPKSDIPWAAVRDAAQAGATEQEIVRAFEISDASLSDPAILTRFRDEIARGHARQAVDLRVEIQRRGKRTARGSGSVNALSLQARNILDWDKQIPAQDVEPDLGTARQRLRDLFVKLAQARSEIEGKRVTALELLHREALADSKREREG